MQLGGGIANGGHEGINRRNHDLDLLDEWIAVGRSKLLSKVAAEPREVEFQSGEMLPELVVQFPGDPPAFGLLGFEGPTEIFNTGLL
jgi:hypothetical protein